MVEEDKKEIYSDSGASELPLIPDLHNLPYDDFLRNSSLNFAKHSTCKVWFYFKKNEGLGEFGDKIVNGIIRDPFKTYCDEVNRTMPDWKEFEGEDLNGELMKTLDYIQHQELNLEESYMGMILLNFIYLFFYFCFFA